MIRHHLANDRQMVFVSGPRQVGKTTVCEGFQSHYLNWDKRSDRDLILKGEDAVADAIDANLAKATLPVLTIDEMHHFKKCLFAVL